MKNERQSTLIEGLISYLLLIQGHDAVKNTLEILEFTDEEIKEYLEED